MRWAKTVYVDEDGVTYTNKDLEEYHYRINWEKQKEYYDERSKQGIIETTKGISIRGKKAKQLSLFGDETHVRQEDTFRSHTKNKWGQVGNNNR